MCYHIGKLKITNPQKIKISISFNHIRTLVIDNYLQ